MPLPCLRTDPCCRTSSAECCLWDHVKRGACDQLYSEFWTDDGVFRDLGQADVAINQNSEQFDFVSCAVGNLIRDNNTRVLKLDRSMTNNTCKLETYINLVLRYLAGLKKAGKFGLANRGKRL